MLQEICWASSKYVRAFRTWWWRWRFYDNVIVEDPHILILALFSLDVDPLALHSQNWDVSDMSREYKAFVSVIKISTKKRQKKSIIIFCASLNGPNSIWFVFRYLHHLLTWILFHYITLHLIFTFCSMWTFWFWFLIFSSLWSPWCRFGFPRVKISALLVWGRQCRYLCGIKDLAGKYQKKYFFSRQETLVKSRKN